MYMEEYIVPEMEIVVFDSEDIITTSGEFVPGGDQWELPEL